MCVVVTGRHTPAHVWQPEMVVLMSLTLVHVGEVHELDLFFCAAPLAPGGSMSSFALHLN